jgi:hypothetical protein
MAINKLSRRTFINKSVCTVSAMPAIALFLNACNNATESKQTEVKKTEEKPEAKAAADPCNDFTGVTEADMQARQKMGYVKASPIAESKCQNCQLFLPYKDSPGCGKCQLFKGPVLTGAYCTYWAPQIAG